jgi:hypothetical protein
MKKLMLRIGIGIVVLVILAGLAVHFFLDSAIKKGVETIGPRLTKVEVKLDRASLSILSGSGKIQGLVVGNPEGFRTKSAIAVGSASLAVQPKSIFSDKVIIHSVNVQGPEITLEAGLHGNNLSKILDNLKASSGAEKQAATKESKPGKKLQVDEFVITGGKVHVSFVGLAGKTANVTLPDIYFKDLGTGPEGITAGELADKVLTAVLNKTLEVSGSAVTDLSKQAAGLTKDLGNSATDAVGKATKGLGDLFKKVK